MVYWRGFLPCAAAPYYLIRIIFFELTSTLVLLAKLISHIKVTGPCFYRGFFFIYINLSKVIL